MTEAEWLGEEVRVTRGYGYEPAIRMIEYLTRIGRAKGKRGQRKLRLFACACCRCVWELLTDERSRNAVEVSERYADGLASKEELASVARTANQAAPDWPLRHAGQAAHAATIPDQVECAKRVVEDIYWAGFHASARWTRRDLADLLRDIFGNPFHPAPIDPSWLAWNGGTVRKLAQAIYDERAFDRLPILADALEEAGCDSQDILAHCRQDGWHVCGCWVVDQLLDRW